MFQVSSIDPAQFGGYRGWHGPARYSPYHVPTHHRLNYVSMASRCSPQATVQYPTLPSSIDYGGYATQSSSVDWARAPYVGSYSPYPDDEETSPYTSQPPPYILPNTDPMSTNNGYYVHGHGVRPHPGALWPDSQHCIPQPSSHLSPPAYTVGTEAPQLIQANGSAGNLPSDRILPTPVNARNFMHLPINAMESVPVLTPNQRNPSCWSSDNSTSTEQIQTGVGATGSQEEHSEGANTSYRIQGMTYGQLSLGEGLSTTSLPSSLPLPGNETQTAPTTTTTEELPSQRSSVCTVSRESLKAAPGSPSMRYGYKGPLSGRNSQVRSASGQLSNGTLYCQSQTMVPRRESPSDDCSPDCSSCQTESTRISVTSISNASSGY